VVLSSTTSTTEALLQQTRTIPIIFGTVADPVGSGLVASLPRPGGHTTGFTNIEGSIAGKWLELLKQIARVNRVALLFNPATAPYAEIYLGPFGAAAAALAVEAIRKVCGRYVRTRIRGWRFYGDSGSLHVQPERTDHFADCPSPPSSDLSVSFLR
jgi:hypothetical protein